jgi:hypothetical protein
MGDGSPVKRPSVNENRRPRIHFIKAHILSLVAPPALPVEYRAEASFFHGFIPHPWSFYWSAPPEAESICPSIIEMIHVRLIPYRDRVIKVESEPVLAGLSPRRHSADTKPEVINGTSNSAIHA